MIPSDACQFLRRVHRRRVMSAVADAACWAVGTAAIVIAIAAAFAFSDPVGLGCGAAAFTAIFAVRVRSATGRFATAVDVDRILKTDELLTTAVYGTGRVGSVDPGFASGVRSVADVRFAAVDPAGLARRRIGVRGWMLAIILVAVAGVSASRPTAGRASGRAEDGSALFDRPFGLVVQTPGQTAGPTGARSVRITDEQGSSQIGSGDSAADDPATAARAGSRSEDRPGHGSAGDGGAGQSQTVAPAGQLASSGGNDSALGGSQVGEGSRPGKGGPGTGGAGTQGGGMPALVDAPWRSNHWAALRAVADAAVSSGAVPVRARSLVRAYFDGE
jgi:hypothetical protein